jgi:hypothetical protein
MGTSHLQFAARIDGSPETVFDLLADMPHYGRWLPGSNAFGGTTQVEPYPVCLGTTYLDAGPAGERPGSVTEFDRPRCLGFHQTMLVRFGPLTADVDIGIRYTLALQDGVTQVVRDVDLKIVLPRLLTLAEPLVLAAFRKENGRILTELKRYLATQRPATR